VGGPGPRDLSRPLGGPAAPTPPVGRPSPATAPLGWAVRTADWSERTARQSASPRDPAHRGRYDWHRTITSLRH